MVTVQHQFASHRLWDTRVACLIAVVFEAGHPGRRWAVTFPGNMRLCNAADALSRLHNTEARHLSGGDAND
jgi:hypothetical protein